MSDPNADHTLHARGRVPFTGIHEKTASDVGLRSGETATRELCPGAAGHRPRRDRNAGRRGNPLVRLRGRHGVRLQRHRDHHEAGGARSGERGESSVEPTVLTLP